MDIRVLMIAALLVITCPATGQCVIDRVDSDEPIAGAEFGFRVDVDGPVVISGAWASDAHSGAAYTIDALTGGTTAPLEPVGAVGNATRFGYSVGLEGGLAVVGAPYDEHAGERSGAVYVFDAATGIQLNRLMAPNPQANAEFGRVVAINDGYLLVGAYLGASGRGSAYLFDAASGSLIRPITAADGLPGDWFGSAVAVNETFTVVGGRFAGTDGGAVYVFDTRSGDQIHKIEVGDQDGNDALGASLGIDGDTIVAGLPALGSVGAAKLFDAVTGAELASLAAAIPTDEQFGAAVAIIGPVALVGAPQNDHDGMDAGAVHLFDIDDPLLPTLLGELYAFDAAVGDRFGLSIACDDTGFVVGAPDRDEGGMTTGSIYLGVLDTSTMPDCNENGIGDSCEHGNDINGNGVPDECDLASGDINLDGVIDVTDMLLLLASWGRCPDPPIPCLGDLDGDGSVIVVDLLALLSNWT